MTHDPRTEEEVYNSLKDSLTNKTEKLTNFTERSFNYVWSVAFSKEIRNLEVLTAVSEMAGWIDYVGGNVTQRDLEKLDLDGLVTTDEINSVMQDEYLDEYVKIVGIERFEGTKSTGTVTIETQSAQTTIPQETAITTAPDNSGNTTNFVTTNQVETANGETTITDVPIEAEAIGIEYNVPADTIIRFEDPPVGVRGVTNPEATTGGEERESNEDLRTRAKNQVEGASEGGTVEGIKAFLRQSVDAIGEGDVLIDEFVDQQPPLVEVVVDGGSDSDVEDAIDESRPTGIKHNLVRPKVIQLGVDASLQGSDIDISRVTENIEDFLLELGINENFYRDELIRRIMETDSGIINIDDLTITFDRVTRERFTYDNNQSDYTLSLTYEDSNGSISIVDEDGNTYTENTDFEVQNQTQDSFKETVVWLSQDSPTDGDDFFVDYDVTLDATSDPYSILRVRDEIKTFRTGVTEQFTYDGDNLYVMSDVSFDGSSSITDNSGDTYAEGTDYEIIDDSGNGLKQTIDWSIGGSTPSNNEDFTITFDKKVYDLSKEIVEDIDDTITDNSGDNYTLNTDFTLVDPDQDGKNESISWNSNPTNLNDQEEFYVSYKTTEDEHVGIKEKIDPSTNRIDVSEV